MPIPVRPRPFGRMYTPNTLIDRLAESDAPHDVRDPLAHEAYSPLAHPGLAAAVVGGEGDMLVEAARAHPIAPDAWATASDTQPLRYNKLYGSSLTSDNDWRWAVDFMATVSGTPGNVVYASFPLVLTKPYVLRVQQYPGSPIARLCLRGVSILGSGTSAGGTSVTYTSPQGTTVDLGTSPNWGESYDFVYLLPDVFTDPTLSNVGTINMGVFPSGTPAAQTVNVNFSVAYLLPMLEPFRTNGRLDQGGHARGIHHPLHGVRINEDGEVCD